MVSGPPVCQFCSFKGTQGSLLAATCYVFHGPFLRLFCIVFLITFGCHFGSFLVPKRRPKSSKMTPQNTIILRPVFNTLQIAKIAHFGTLGATKSCFSLKRGAILAISRFFTLLSKMRDFGLTNHLDLRHLDPPTRSQKPVENQADFQCNFRSILASILCPRGMFLLCLFGVQMRVMAPGSSKVVIFGY